ncbi:unnamed protein product, partial [Amoebophrya sp. A120]
AFASVAEQAAAELSDIVLDSFVEVYLQHSCSADAITSPRGFYLDERPQEEERQTVSGEGDAGRATGSGINKELRSDQLVLTPEDRNILVPEVEYQLKLLLVRNRPLLDSVVETAAHWQGNQKRFDQIPATKVEEACVRLLRYYNSKGSSYDANSNGGSCLHRAGRAPHTDPVCNQKGPPGDDVAVVRSKKEDVSAPSSRVNQQSTTTTSPRLTSLMSLSSPGACPRVRPSAAGTFSPSSPFPRHTRMQGRHLYATGATLAASPSVVVQARNKHSPVVAPPYAGDAGA